MATTEKERAAHHDAVELPTTDVAAMMIQHLPLGIIAEVSAVRETRAVREWAEGKRAPRPHQEQRLRIAAQMVSLTVMQGRPWVPNAWMITPLPGGEASPFTLLRDLPEDDAERAEVLQVLAASALELHGVPGEEVPVPPAE